LDTSFFGLFAFSFAVGFGAVISPGPVSAAIISQSPRQGWMVGPLISTGHALLEGLVVLLIAFGLTAGLAQPAVQMVIGILGGLLLIWMGAGMLAGALRSKTRLPGEGIGARQLSRPRIFLLGMLTTITNPFWYAWWVTVAAGYLAQARLTGGTAVAAFYLGHISADYGWNTLLSTVIGSGKRWLSGRVYQWINSACGAFLVLLGISFLIQGIRLI